MKIKYFAFDGTEHQTEATCLAYEQSQAPRRIVGLTAEAIDAALRIYDLPIDDRKPDDVDLATALEDVGIALQRARLNKREVKRERKAKAPAAPADGAPHAAEGGSAPANTPKDLALLRQHSDPSPAGAGEASPAAPEAVHADPAPLISTSPKDRHDAGEVASAA